MGVFCIPQRAEEGMKKVDAKTLTLRKELALSLLDKLKNSYSELDEAASDIGNNSNSYYEEAFKEKSGEFSLLMDDYGRNVERIRQINNEIIAAINKWYQFIKDENRIGKVSFPIRYFLGKRSLNKKILKLNAENSDITINNRFLRGKLSELEHQLEVDAIVQVKSGGNYQKYENILAKQKIIATELNYLLPTIPGACPADISPEGIDGLMQNIAL